MQISGISCDLKSEDTLSLCQVVNAEGVTQRQLNDRRRVEVILNAYAAGIAEYATLGNDGRRVLEGFLVRFKLMLILVIRIEKMRP